MSQKKLSIMLSKLQVFKEPAIRLEQYPIDSEIAGETLWFAKMQGDIERKVIADLGSGTGILGLGALLLGAKKAFLVDIDTKAMELAMKNKKQLEEENGKKLEAVFSAGDVNLFDQEADVVIMNPPFGTQQEKIDTQFLLKAMSIAPVIYSFHKASTKEYIDKLIKDNGFKITHYKEYNFPLKQSMKQHKKKIEKIKVGMWRMEKK